MKLALIATLKMGIPFPNQLEIWLK